jgi:hypothetical protein
MLQLVLAHGKVKKGKTIPIQAVEALRVREVEDLTFSDIRLTDGSKVVSLMRRPLFTPRKITGTHFCQKKSRHQGHSAAGMIR